ncbi:galectin-9 isoform X2 [Paroedura picta]|uniref:galectin-9 isoform X2 n=1 Tax=Paroedura picta TaxID=143630 RepID=UPI0040579038
MESERFLNALQDPMPSGTSLTALVEDWQSRLMAAIDKIAPRRPLRLRLKQAPWYSQELRERKKAVRRLERVWRKTRDKATRTSHCTLMKAYENAVKAAKRDLYAAEIAFASSRPAQLFKPIPFTGPICGGLCEGLIVTVTGSVLHLCTRFQINFQCGSAKVPQPDIAFHFNPRFDEGGCMVWNSFERGSWQHEERQSSMPFHKGHPFEIRFLVKSSSYMVAVNGKHYLEFKHRIPISRVDTISVSGDLEVASITFQGPAAPALWTAQAAAMTNAAFPLGMPYNGAGFPPGPYFQPQIYSLPYQASLFGGLFPSRSVIVSGTVLARASRFHINLKMGQDTAFHLNPRFKEKVIVRNSQFSGRWGPEERHLRGSMPLHPEQAFTIWIQCEQQCFRVAVNGQHQFDYYHRAANLQQIDRLEIEGDVLLSEVRA